MSFEILFPCVGSWHETNHESLCRKPIFAHILRKSDKAFIYVSLGGIKGIYSRRELNVFASQSQQFDLFLIGLLDLYLDRV